MCTPGFRWDTVNLFPKESIIDFSSFKHASQQKQRERGTNIKNIILQTVVNLPFVIVFGGWSFIDLRGEKTTGTDKAQKRVVLCFSLVISFGLNSGSCCPYKPQQSKHTDLTIYSTTLEFWVHFI